MSFKVAVVGATGNVGREMLNILATHGVEAADVVAVASERSVGAEVSYGEDDVLKVQDLDKYDFKGIDIALFSPGAKVSAVHAPRAAKAGAVVIDNTSQFRMDPDVPLVVPEVNPEAIAQYTKRGIIANPNCSTIQMVMALKPLHDLAQDQARGGRHIPVGLRRRPRGDGRALHPDARRLRQRHAEEGALHQADRLQRHSPHRRLHGGRLDQGGMEDGCGDAQDP